MHIDKVTIVLSLIIKNVIEKCYENIKPNLFLNLITDYLHYIDCIYHYYLFVHEFSFI